MIYELMTDDEKQLAQLESELSGMDRKIADAAHRGEESVIADLSRRKAELPALIAGTKSNILRDRISELRQSVAVSRADVSDAEQEANRLTMEFPDKVRALGQEQERLQNEASQAHWRRDSLTATLKEKEQELRRVEKQLEKMLLDHYAPNGSI
jgi:chromosome segregation ATPase